MRYLRLAFLCLLSFATESAADLVIGRTLSDAMNASGGVGNVEIPAGQSSFDLNFFAVDCLGTEASAFTAVVTVGDNGDIGAGAANGIPNVPGLVAIDVVTDTPWPSQPPLGATIDAARRQGGINSGALGANVGVSGSKMGTVTLSTIGISPGSYSLVFDGSSFAGGGTDACGDHAVAQTLTVTAIPEPSCFLTLSIIGVLLAGRHWHAKQSTVLE